MTKRKSEEEQAAEVLQEALGGDVTKKPGFADMMLIGSRMMVILPLLGTSHSKIDVDLHEGSLSDFIVKTHWGNFIVHKVPAAMIEQPEASVYWGVSTLQGCSEHAEGHWVRCAYVSEDGIDFALTFGLMTTLNEHIRIALGHTCNSPGASMH